MTELDSILSTSMKVTSNTIDMGVGNSTKLRAGGGSIH